MNQIPKMKKPNISYIVWKNYQRRAEVFAKKLEAELVFMPHIFKSKYLRLFDYFLKLIATFKHIRKHQSDVMIFQSPPIYAAIPALLMRIPYIIDTHNVAIQGNWYKLPMTKYLMSQASGVIVHNDEIFQLAQKLFPHANLISILDPIENLSVRNRERLKNQILVVCSFANDEPVNVIIDSIINLPNYVFVITADLNKLQDQQRQSLCQLKNVKLTGFLPTQEYQDILCSSLAALVLTTREATQPSGACEALSSDTQLIVSDTSLTKKLFGEWGIFVDNSVESIIEAVESLQMGNLDLSTYRNNWNISVNHGFKQLYSCLFAKSINHSIDTHKEKALEN
jgi:glycosyltransferase involved in cell wall biosynthesis